MEDDECFAQSFEKLVLMVQVKECERSVLFKKKSMIRSYNKENNKPVIKARICNGEQIVGFKDGNKGKIEEVIPGLLSHNDIKCNKKW